MYAVGWGAVSRDQMMSCSSSPTVLSLMATLIDVCAWGRNGDQGQRMGAGRDTTAQRRGGRATHKGRVVPLGEADGDERQRLRLLELSELGAEDVDGVEVLVERLLAQAGLAGLCDLEHERGVRRVGRDDDDGVDGLVGQDLVDRACDLGLVRVGRGEGGRGGGEGVKDGRQPGRRADGDDGFGVDCVAGRAAVRWDGGSVMVQACRCRPDVVWRRKRALGEMFRTERGRKGGDQGGGEMVCVP